MSDNAKVQALLDKAGKVKVPAGTYMIDADIGLKVKSDSQISMSGVTLRVIANSNPKYDIVRIIDAKNVTISGGSVIGDRGSHKGTGKPHDEFGMGFTFKRSENITLDGVVSQDCWGDGFYMGSGKNITLRKVVSSNNRRQGLSIISVDTMEVIDSIFENTHGTDPQAGIDIEPDKDLVVKNVLIDRCIMRGNAGAGFEYAPKRGKCSNIRVTPRCEFSDNDGGSIKDNTLSWLGKLLIQLGISDPATTLTIP